MKHPKSMFQLSGVHCNPKALHPHRRGALPDSSEHPNPKHPLADYGPNLYQVGAQSILGFRV